MAAMIIPDVKDKVYPRLKHVPGFERAFSWLMSELSQGHVWAYDTHGFPHECTDEELDYIGDFEARMYDVDIDATVYAIIRSTMLLGPTSEVSMTAYLYSTPDADEVMIYESSTYYALAQVVNHTWGMSEAGSVLIEEHMGRIKRVG